jgi:uncharacterized protein
MPLKLSLAALEKGPVRLSGSLTPEELDFDPHDPLIRAGGPLAYDLRAELIGPEILVRGSVRMPLACECARCLRPFASALDFPEYTLLVPLEGEEAAPVDGEVVTLTPFLREDSLLALPTHPVCGEACPGLPGQSGVHDDAKAGPGAAGQSASAWSALANLKFD